jgi:phospholipase/carboxylesterase
MYSANIVLLLALCAAGCATGSPAAAEADADSTWIELDGARLLMTTTHAARGRSHHGLPLLIVLPWSRSTPLEVLAEVGYRDIDVPARIIAIQGFEADRGGFSWWRRTRPAPGDPDLDGELVSLLRDRAQRLAALIAAVQRHLGGPPVTVVSGVSQGGDLGIALGILHPDRISAALPIASRFPAPLWPAAKTSAASPAIDAFQGALDPVAPIAALEAAFAALRSRGFPVVLHRYDEQGHDIAPTMAADVRACAALRLRGVDDACVASGR